MKQAAKIIHQLRADFILVKGRVMERKLRGIDILFDENYLHFLEGEVIKIKNNYRIKYTLLAIKNADLSLQNIFLVV